MRFKFPDTEQEQIEFIHDTVLEYFKGSKELSRQWFEGENICLKGETPIKHIRSGNIELVFKAVKNLVDEKLL